ncbi:fumarylacetoacetate hydrolase family protein [Planctomonas psychrotolerans]|uniref:fumarylacetoacetate hydrolase family protein n=1 Tax=Planctomonas psychrotolerans TaxID=2528712 RepID=UPI00123AF060|nr:fumarylacetoacetate hydrolase family protein [Planctomonas psychrotolerans]
MRFAHLIADGDTTTRLAVLADTSEALFLDEILDDAPRDLQDLIERGADEVSRVTAVLDRARASGVSTTPLADTRFDSGILRPPAIYAVGLNYRAHADELNIVTSSAPTVFALWPNSLAGHGGETSWSPSLTEQVDYEVELGVIIGTPARDVPVENALDHVFGYTVVNDITARDLQFSEQQWSRCKSFDGFTPTGPVVVTRDEVADPQDLRIRAIVDGEVLQDGSTSEMVRTVAQLISFLSRSATLMPGTLISTGTTSGAGYSRDPQVFLVDGSTVTVSVEGIGELTTHTRFARA